MADTRYILFYSKYSKTCRPLLEKLAKRNTTVTEVCIDNEGIRNKIKRDKKIGISVVPTFLIVYKTGIVEKYEGLKAAQLLKEMYPERRKRSPTYTSGGATSFEDLPEVAQVQKPPPDESPAKTVPAVVNTIAESPTVQAPIIQPPVQEVVIETIPPVQTKQVPAASTETTDTTKLLDLGDNSESDSGDPPIQENLSSQSKQETGRGGDGGNLPIKPNSKVASLVASMQADRNAMDQGLKRGPQNNMR